MTEAFDSLEGFRALPPDARCLALLHNSKEPATRRGHHDAMSVDTFVPIGNYGIALDGQFLLVDFDSTDPMRDSWTAKLPATWRQKTPRGEHYLYRVPADWKGTNRKIVAEGDGARKIVGDVKSLGYLVGPGSVVNGAPYVVLDGVDPVPAPDWLLDFAVRREDFTLNGVVQERAQIVDGERDNELTALAGWLRHKGFSAQAIASMLWGVVESGVVEQPPGREVEQRDVIRIARSIGRRAIGDDYGIFEGQLSPEGWINGAAVDLIGPPIRWWVRGFVPQSELVMLYGKGGIGKSSWASWLAGEVTRKGGSFLYVGVEEPFSRFLMRAVLGGADRERIFSIPGASVLQFPRDCAAFHEAVATARPSVVYFDSIYSHFAAEKGLNTAERARQCLGPLAEIAQATGSTLMGVFHENKAGDYLGSVEMVNVARYVLKATRSGRGPLRIAVDKTNIWDPHCMLQFEALERICADEGIEQMEEQADGTLAPLKTIVLHRIGDRQMDIVTSGDLDEDDDENTEKPTRKGRKGAST